MREQAPQAYPLTWPLTIPRWPASARKRAAFSTRRDTGSGYRQHAQKGHNEALRALQEELDRLGAQNIVLSSNQRLRIDGSPYATETNVADPGCAVYFTLKATSYCLPCDKWDRLADNIYAVAMHIGAIRGMERWGVGSLEQQFLGYKALAATSEEAWWDVLEVRPDASIDIIQANYRARARSAHPDTGGSEAAMARLNTARDRAIADKQATT